MTGRRGADNGRVLAAIRRLTVNFVPPSYEELRVALGLGSRGQVHARLHHLRALGLIDFDPRRARSLRIMGEHAWLEGRPTDELREMRESIDAILKGRVS